MPELRRSPLRLPTSIRTSGITGEALQKAAANAAELGINTDLVGRVLNAFNEEGIHAAEIMDHMFVASQKTGIGIDDLNAALVKNSGTFNAMGLSMDESIALLGQFHQEGINSRRAMSGLSYGDGESGRTRA